MFQTKKTGEGDLPGLRAAPAKRIMHHNNKHSTATTALVVI
jgi:hypothetical protein